MRAYTALLEKTGEDKYHRIPATVLTDISADEAHEIVVDSNYVQRVLTPSEKARSISQKYALAGRKKRSRNGVRKSKYEQIGEEYNLSARQIARYVRLGSLDGSLLTLLDGGKLPLTTALRLVDFPAESQKYLAAHHADEQPPLTREGGVAAVQADLPDAGDLLLPVHHVIPAVVAALERQFPFRILQRYALLAGVGGDMKSQHLAPQVGGGGGQQIAAVMVVLQLVPREFGVHVTFQKLNAQNAVDCAVVQDKGLRVGDGLAVAVSYTHLTLPTNSLV